MSLPGPWRRDSLRPVHSRESRYGTPPPAYRASVHGKTSLDITQRVERKLAQYNASENLFKRWLFEIISVATSAFCMGAIVAILVSINNQPLSKWPLALTVVTVLSKIASAALILPISEAIGQLKWSWFHGKESKDAFDFEIFDKASRGAWGSILLLFRTRGKSLAALGALLTIMLLAIDTFFQQVTDQPERWTPFGKGLVPRIVRYDPPVVWSWQSDYDGTMTVANPEMRGALVPLYYEKSSTENPKFTSNQPDIPVSCPTSRCTWAPYRTLGVCSACADISSLLTYACLPMRMDWIRNATGQGTEYTYQNGTACGYFMNATSSAPVLLSGYRNDNSSNSTHGETLLMRIMPLLTNPNRERLWDGSINFRHIGHPLMDALIVSSADGSASSVYRKDLPVAHECILAWCVKTLNSSHSWGNYEETVQETFFNTTKVPHPWKVVNSDNGQTFVTDFFGNVSIYPPDEPRDGQGYGVSNDTMFDITYTLDEIFPSFITVTEPEAKPLMKYRTSFVDKVVYRAFHSSPWLAPNNITRHMEKMATALTNLARSEPGGNEFVEGQAFAPETYIKVNWGWLTFPLAMLTLCILFLVATIVKTSRAANNDIGMWKTSAMPTLIYSLPQDVRQDLTGNSTWKSSIADGANKVKIRLVPNRGWRVSGRTCTSLSPTLLRKDDNRAPPGWI